jgi:hypothetical protein
VVLMVSGSLNLSDIVEAQAGLVRFQGRHVHVVELVAALPMLRWSIRERRGRDQPRAFDVVEGESRSSAVT